MKGSLNIKQKSLYENKNFMVLLIGQIVSNLGNAVHSVAIAWFIMNKVGENLSGTYMAIFGACVLIPYIICGPISGVYVDRIDRKKIIVGTDLIRGSLTLVLGLLVYNNIYPMISLFTITSLNALVGTFFNPAVDASIPNIVEEQELTQANSLNGISRQLTWIIGGGISGFLYDELGIVGIFAVNGISFILSGISETFIQLPEVKKKVDQNFSFWKDFKSGIDYVKNHKTILKVMIFSLALNFMFNPLLQIVFPKTVKFTLDMGPKEYGFLYSLFPVGAILGMILLSMLSKSKKNIPMVQIALVVQPLMLLGFGIPIFPSILKEIGSNNAYILYCIMAIILMICNSLINIPFLTAVQKIVSDEYRGRFFALLNTMSQGIVPIGLGVFGVLSDLVNPSTLFLSVGAGAFLMGIWMLLIPEFKEII